MHYDVTRVNQSLCKILIDNYPSLSKDIQLFMIINSKEIFNKISSTNKMNKYPTNFYFNGYDPNDDEYENNFELVNIQKKFSILRNKMDTYINTHKNIHTSKNINDFYKESFNDILFKSSDTFTLLNDIISYLYLKLDECFLNITNRNEAVELFNNVFELLIFKSEGIKAREEFIYSQYDENYNTNSNPSFIQCILSLIYNELTHNNNLNNIHTYINLLYSNTDLDGTNFIKLISLYSKICNNKDITDSIKLDTKNDFMESLAKLNLNDKSKKIKLESIVYDDLIIPYGFTKNEFYNIISHMPLPNNISKNIPNETLINYFGTFKKNYSHMGMYNGNSIIHILKIDGDLYLMTVNNQDTNQIILIKIDLDKYKSDECFEIKMNGDNYDFKVGDDI